MNKIHIVRNWEVNKVLEGVPEDYKHLKHLRVCVTLENGLVLVFQEATIAKILRECITMKKHPGVRTQEPQMKTLAAGLRKEGYVAHQLLEVPRENEDVEREPKSFLKKGENL